MVVIGTEMFSLKDIRLGFNLMHFTCFRRHLGLLYIITNCLDIFK